MLSSVFLCEMQSGWGRNRRKSYIPSAPKLSKVILKPMIWEHFMDFDGIMEISQTPREPNGFHPLRTPRGCHFGDFFSTSGCVLPNENKGLERIPPKSTFHENRVGTYVSPPLFQESPGRAGESRIQGNIT